MLTTRLRINPRLRSCQSNFKFFLLRKCRFMKRKKIAVEHAVPCSGSDITELECTYVFYILATLLNLKIRHGPKNCAVNRIHFMREAVWKMVVILPWNFAINNPWSLWKTFSINKAKCKRTTYLLCISKLILLSCWMRIAYYLFSAEELT